MYILIQKRLSLRHLARAKVAITFNNTPFMNLFNGIYITNKGVLQGMETITVTEAVIHVQAKQKNKIINRYLYKKYIFFKKNG